MTAEALEIQPADGPLDATVGLPGSKSITNRALVCAALATGTSTLRRALDADDTRAMLQVLGRLGVRIDVDWEYETVVVAGLGGAFAPGDRDLDARMSGTTARFVAPFLGLVRGRSRLGGHPQLAARPMATAVDALTQLGVRIRAEGPEGRLPLVVEGEGTIDGGTVRIPGDVSSQFLSGLLLAAPLMRAGIEVALTTPLVSRPYVDLTASVMTRFGAGVAIDREGRRFSVAPTGYRAAELPIEPDASSASYLFAAAAVCGGRVRVEGLDRGSGQGDIGFVNVLARMGCEVTTNRGWIEVRGSQRLVGVDVDLSGLSDTAPTLAVVAAFASSPTQVRGIGFIRRKETDRIAAVVTELRRCGVDAVEEDDGFVVHPSTRGPAAARVETYEDHRMAMAFAVLGLRVPGTVIVDPGCVTKTFPDFFEVLEELR